MLRVSLFILIWCVITVAQSQAPAPTPSKLSQADQNQASPKDRKGGSDRQPTKQAPTPSGPTTPIVSSGDPQSKLNNNPNGPPVDRWGRGSTVFITIFTGALTWLAYRQWQSMVKQSEYMREGLESSQKAADAAIKSAEVAEAALRLTQRAYLQVGTWETVALKNPIELSFVIENSGQTLATIDRIQTRIVTSVRLPETITYGRKESVSLPLAPRARWRQWIHADGTLSLDEVSDNRTNLWFFGYLEYHDVFGVSHKLGFCVRYNCVRCGWEIDGPPAYQYST